MKPYGMAPGEPHTFALDYIGLLEGSREVDLTKVMDDLDVWDWFQAKAEAEWERNGRR